MFFLNSRFPQNPERRKEWMINVRRDKWSPSKSAVICSDNFLEKIHQ